MPPEAHPSSTRVLLNRLIREHVRPHLPRLGMAMLLMVIVASSTAALAYLMEPVMDLEVVVPEKYLGDVIGDLNSHRGDVKWINPRSDAQVITAKAPLSETFGYATRLRSLTQGRAVFTLQFANFREVPKQITDEIIAKVRGVEAA